MKKLFFILIIPLLMSCSEAEESSVDSRQLTIINEKPNTIITFATSEIFILNDISVEHGETKTYDINEYDYDGKTSVRVDYVCSSQTFTAADGPTPIYRNFNEKKTYTIILKSTGSACDESILEEL